MSKKKNNYKHYTEGDSIDIVNYISDSHILRSRYNTGTNEITITDVPQSLTSTFTLGQGAGTDIPDIKVIIGKSFSGTDMVDNANRAITDMIPFDGDTTKPLQIYCPSGYMFSIKKCTANDKVSTVGYMNGDSSLIGTTITASDWKPWGNMSTSYILEKDGSNLFAYADFSDGNGYLRLLFKVGESGTTPPQDIFDGYCYISEKLYHLSSAEE